MIKILLLEKNVILANYLKEVFINDKQFHLIDICREGYEVRETIKKRSIDVLLIDHLQTDGLVTTSWIKSKYPRIRVIAFSTVEEEEILDRVIQLGVYSYLYKYKTPLDKLVEEIKSVAY